MCKLFVSILLASCLGIVLADHHLIAAGCDTDAKTCYQFSDCATTSAPSTPNLATTYYTTGDSVVEFQIQYDNINAGWIAIGLSNTQNMPDSYIFMCVRRNASSVQVQERFATARARPPEVTSLLTTVSTASVGSLLNCTFTTPVSRTPLLSVEEGYFVLLAWGPYSSNNIQVHTSRCVTASRVVVTGTTGVTTAQPTPTPAPGRCNGGSTCISFSGCGMTTLSNSTDIASFVTESDNSLRFNLEHTTNNETGWIAIGFSATPSMLDSYIFLCHRGANSGVIIQARYAGLRTLPTIVTPSGLTPVSYTNDQSILNCTFTSPVSRIPVLNNPNGYYVLLARGQYDTEIQFHGAYRCVTSERVVITTAVGDSGTAIVPTVCVIYGMVALLLASYLLL